MVHTRRPFDNSEFRSAMGKFATGVTVITAQLGDLYHGMTANAFMSLSLDPPLVAVAVAKSARMHRLLHRAPRFGISVLAHHQEHVARYFAGQNMTVPQGSIAFSDSVPLVDKAVAHFLCRLTVANGFGDHTLFIGEVESLAQFDGAPLLFYEGCIRGETAAQRIPSPGAEVDDKSAGPHSVCLVQEEYAEVG